MIKGRNLLTNSMIWKTLKRFSKNKYKNKHLSPLFLEPISLNRNSKLNENKEI